MYPYDSQTPVLKIASTDYANQHVRVSIVSSIFHLQKFAYNISLILDFKITTDYWNSLTKEKRYDVYGKPFYDYDRWIWSDGIFANPSSFEKILHHEYLDNLEWQFRAYKFHLDSSESITDTINNNYSTLTVELVVRRNLPYYAITMFVPIFVMTVLSPIGLILPGRDFILKLCRK